jgi:hypothetical protein
MAFIPYQPNAEAWKKHFQAMADGKMDYKGSFYALAPTRDGTSGNTEPIKVVAPSAQVVEQAKSELKRESRESGKRSAVETPNRKPPAKRGKSKLLKEPESDFLSN